MINSTQQTMYRLGNLNMEQERINHQLSTGKKLQYGSDDSNIYTREVYINDKIKMYEGIKSQIDKTSAQNNGADSALSEAKKLVSFVKAEVIKALNDTVDDSSRTAIAENLRGVKENLLDLANEQVEGEYVFSGSDSSVKPFEIDETTGVVSYVGDTELRKVAVEDGSYRDRGIHGEEGFYYSSGTVPTGGTLDFSKNDLVYDEYGNEWEVYRTIQPNDSLYFNPGNEIVDENDVMWTLNAAVPQLEDGSGNVIPATNHGSYYEVTVPNSTNGMFLNQLRKYDENDNLIGGIALAISGTYPDDLNVTVPSDPAFLEAKTSVFDVLDNIIDALDKVDDNGDALTSDEAKSALQRGLTDITNSYDSMNTGHAKLGGRNKVIEISLERISAKTFQYERLQQEVSGVDLAEVAVEAKALELTYTSLYSTINKTNELSLVNFLR